MTARPWDGPTATSPTTPGTFPPREVPDLNPDLEIWVDDERHLTTVGILGEVDAHTSGSLRRLLSRLYADGRRHFALDLSGVSFLDASGLTVLLGAKRRFTEGGGSLTIMDASAAVRRASAAAGVAGLLGVPAQHLTSA